MQIFFIALALLLIALIGIVVVRAVMFVPIKETYKKIEMQDFDKDYAIESLKLMIKCKTISYNDKSLEDKAEFEKFRALLKERYPNITSNCTMQLFDESGILYLWKGKSSENPSVLMSHYDVVPVEEKSWSKPPFDAVVEDGVLWGRGTLDTKTTLLGVMESTEHLIKQGFVPQNDIYLAFAGDEEVAGNAQPTIVKYMQDNNIKPALVLDEGGAVVEDIFPGVTQKTALIGIAEKGMLNVLFEANSKGGHASAPPPHTPVGVIAQAAVKLENKPFKAQLSQATKEMFNTLGRYSNFTYKLIFSNLWLFCPLLDYICTKKGGELNALMRTTCALTKLQGSEAFNVIPPKAVLGANLRLLGEDTPQSALEYMKGVINNDDIKIKEIYSMPPCKCSRTDSDAYKVVQNAIASTWENTIISPYLMIACSDSRHYAKISDNVYRFSAMELSKEERATIHAHDERIPLDKAVKVVEFYHKIIVQL